MPFGLCNATSTISRLMDKVDPACLKDRVLVNLDDLLVVSSSFESHMGVLRKTALYLKRAGLTINNAKSPSVGEVCDIWDTLLAMAKYEESPRR